MSLKAKLEAIIYAAETPITLDHIVELLNESAIAEGATEDEVKSRVRIALEELTDDCAASDRGVEIRRSRADIACPPSRRITTLSVILPRA